MLPVRALARQAVATVFAMPAAFAVLHVTPAPLGVRLFASGLAFAAAYLGLSWARGWLPAGWIALFRAAAPRAAAASEP